MTSHAYLKKIHDARTEANHNTKQSDSFNRGIRLIAKNLIESGATEDSAHGQASRLNNRRQLVKFRQKRGQVYSALITG